MNKILFFLLFIITFLFSCNRSDNFTIYNQDQLKGTWEDVEKDENGCTSQLVFNSLNVISKRTCEDGSLTYYNEPYSFNGNIIYYTIYNRIDVEMIIEKLTDRTLIVTIKTLKSINESKFKKV